MTCPTCRATLHPSATSCPACGRGVGPAADPPGVPVGPPPSLDLPGPSTRRPDQAPPAEPPAPDPGANTGLPPRGPGQGAELPAGDPKPPSPWRWLALVATVAVVVLAGALALVVARGRSDEDRTLRIRLVAADAPDEDPFTGSTSTVEVPDGFATGTAPADAGSPGRRPTGSTLTPVGADGGAAGLYGSVAGSDATAVCDVAALTEALGADPAAVRVWADLQGLEPDAVGPFLAGLAPVVLGRDTLVTNTSYVGGRGSRFAAVLQAGTPVLVDGRGVPRVKCSCGNPLLPAPEALGTAGASTEVEVEGDPWERFDLGGVTVVEGAAEPVETLQTVDLSSGDPTEVALGTTSGTELDGYLVTDHLGIHVVSEDGTSWTTVSGHHVAAAFDDGAGGLLYQERRSSKDGYSLLAGPSALVDVPPTNQEQGTLWYLRAEATEAEALVVPQPPEYVTPALMGGGTLGGRPVAVYASTFYEGAEGAASASLDLRDLETGEERVVQESGWNAERYNATSSISVGPDAILSAYGHDGTTYWQRVDADLRPVPIGCPDGTLPGDPGCGVGGVQMGDLLVGIELDDGTTKTIRAIDLGTGEVAHRIDLSAEPALAGSDLERVIDALDDEVLVKTTSGDLLVVGLDGSTRPVPLPAQMLRSTATEVRFLRAPLRRPAPPDPAGLEAPTFEELLGTEVTSLCEHPATTLVEGRNQDVTVPNGKFALVPDLTEVTGEPDPAIVRGLPSEVGPLTVAIPICHHGGVSWPTDLVFFSPGGRYYAETFLEEVDWPSLGLVAPARTGVYEMRVDGDEMVIRLRADRAEDAACCPTGAAEVRLVAADGGLRITAATAIEPPP